MHIFITFMIFSFFSNFYAMEKEPDRMVLDNPRKMSDEEKVFLKIVREKKKHLSSLIKTIQKTPQLNIPSQDKNTILGQIFLLESTELFSERYGVNIELLKDPEKAVDNILAFVNQY